MGQGERWAHMRSYATQWLGSGPPRTYGAIGFMWALGALACLALHPSLSLTSLLLLFVPSIATAALLTGARLGLAVSAASLASVWEMAGADGPIWSEPGAIIFTSVSVLISLGGAWAMREHAAAQRALQVLSAREAHLTSILDSSPDAMIVINDLGTIESYGASAERLFGWRPAEALGRSVNILMPTAERSQHDNYIARYLRTGEARVIGKGRAVEGVHKDGTVFPMQLAIGESQSRRGRYFTAFAHDLTEKLATETRLAEVQEELAHVSRLSAMGEIASTLAHELNQPLAAVANYIAGARVHLERGETNRALVEDTLDKAAQQALRAGDIIRRLRQFLARGRVERHAEDLNALVVEACDLALVGMRHSRPRVVFELDESLGHVHVDRVQIQQVVVNIVRNAVEAMHARAPAHIRVRTQSGEDGFALASISDSGPGLSEDAAERLFTPFNSTKPHGMGVGLSISRTIIEAHGGRIWCDRGAEGGADFKFTVPFAHAEDDARAAP